MPFQHSMMKSWGTASENILPFAGSVLLNAWIVNSPQIVLSFCYLGLNSICTAVSSAEEWNNLARSRRGLRVTQPKGEQRSTYFLQLPYKWAIPLVSISGALHWLLSQSFFLVRLDMIDRNGNTVPSESKSACGFSPLSLLIFFIVALILVCVVGYAGLRHFQQRMPTAASCSLVISAACHPPKKDDSIQLKKVKWGVVEQGEGQNFGHCCISSERVKKPEVGKTYY